MGCCSCFGSGRKEGSRGTKGGENGAASSSAAGGREGDAAASHVEMTPAVADAGKAGGKKDTSVLEEISMQTFTLCELAAAANNFRDECLIGEGGFGRVYKGRLDGTGQVVAIKQLNKDGHQGNREFQVEVVMLSLLCHENLVNLVGYCVDGDQRLLVYEYMPLGSLEDHLHDLAPGKVPLDWKTRMTIAAGAAKGLQYLHGRDRLIIFRDLKTSNILLGEGFHPKLSDFGLAKLGPVGDKSHVSTRVMGTYGYCAPEYAMTGQLTIKSDIYSLGVVLLELITGRKPIDDTRPREEQNLVTWARPLFKDKQNFWMMADPGLAGQYPKRGLYQAIAVAYMCLQSEAACRPIIADVVAALTYLSCSIYDPSTSNRGGRGDQVSIVVDSGRALSKNRDSGSSSHKSSNKDRVDSPREQARIMNREQMVAEAKMWGESCREKRRVAASSQGSLDRPSGSGDS